MNGCPASERLVAYLCSELPEPEEEALEAHLFGCASCTSETEGLAGVIAAVRATVPPVLGPAAFEALRREGHPFTLNPMLPGQHADVEYPAPGRLLVHRLSGLDLAHARRVDVILETSAGTRVGALEDVPFNRDRGEVLLACQAHYAEMFPPDVVFVLQVVDAARAGPVARYSVLHRLP
jgi:anti-sigma factor RsiW